MKSLKVSAVLLLVAAAAYAADDVKSVEATGEAAIVNNDVVKAHDDAKKAALRNAVEQVAGTMISAQTLVQNSQLVSDRIFSNAQGYVKSYSSPAFTDAGGVSSCKLTAQVSTASLDKDLQAVQALVKSMEGKKMIVLIQEQTITPTGTVTQGGSMAEILSAGLKQDGWHLIDSAFANGKLKLNAAVGMGAAEAKEIGNLTKADYILYGTASFSRQVFDQKSAGALLNNNQIFPVSGEYSLSVFATDSGTQLANISGALKFKSKDGITKSIISYERTTVELVKDNQGDILSNVRGAIYKDLGSNGGARLVVDVNGLPDYGAAEDFKKVLEDRRGVQSVDVSYADGKANYDVIFAGSSGDLATQFSKKGGKEPTFQGKKIVVTGKSANRVELSVK